MGQWTFLGVALVLNAAANVLLKVGSKTAEAATAGPSAAAQALNFLNLPTACGIFLFAANVLFYRKALDSVNISVAYPIMVGGSMILVALAAWLLPAIEEQIHAPQLIGMALILAGVWLVSRMPNS